MKTSMHTSGRKTSARECRATILIVLLATATTTILFDEADAKKTKALRRHRRQILQIESPAFQQTFFTTDITQFRPKVSPRLRSFKKSTKSTGKLGSSSSDCDTGDFLSDLMCARFLLSMSMSTENGRGGGLSMSMPFPPSPSEPSVPSVPTPIEPTLPTVPTPTEPSVPITTPAATPAPTPAPTPAEPSVPTPEPNLPTAPSEPTISPAQEGTPTDVPAPTADPDTNEPSGPPNDATPTDQPNESTLAPTKISIPAPTNSPVSGGVTGPTTAPFAECRSKDRQTALASLVEGISPEAVSNSASPQGQALQWITNEDPASIDPCTYPTVEQRFALATLYFATEGDSWLGSEYWLSEEPECAWLGISCDDDEKVEAIVLGTYCCKSYHACFDSDFSSNIYPHLSALLLQKQRKTIWEEPSRMRFAL